MTKAHLATQCSKSQKIFAGNRPRRRIDVWIFHVSQRRHNACGRATGLLKLELWPPGFTFVNLKLDMRSKSVLLKLLSFLRLTGNSILQKHEKHREPQGHQSRQKNHKLACKSWEGLMWVHSSVARAADCRSAGPWFKSGCALSHYNSPKASHAMHHPPWGSNPRPQG